MKNELCFPEDPYDDLGFLFWQIMKAWQRGKHKLLDEFGITASQMEILSAIYHLSSAKEEVTQIAISNLTSVDPMTTSTILRNLQKKNLINRKSSEVDTRARTVEITEEGEELFVKAVTKVRASTAEVLKSIDEEKLKEQFRILLNVLTEINN
jgi:DNA-binding MarR family transcriptional regulator